MSILAEFARATQQSSSAFLFDVVKAFENIRHPVLQRNGARYNFSVIILRFLLMMYRMPRTVRIGKLATSKVCAGKTVVPGCSFADILMRLALMPTLDSLCERWSHIHVGAVIDDIQLLAVGDRRATEYEMSQAATFVIQDLRTQGLEIDTTARKLVVLASNSAAFRRLSCRVASKNARQERRTMVMVAKNLGVDYSLLRRSTAVQSARLRLATKKARRLSQVRRGDASVVKVAQVARAGVTATALYGAGIVGVSNTAATRVRSAVHKA